MKIAYVVLCIVGAGLIGGLLNAYFTEKGFILPRYETLPDGQKIFRPGFIGNVLVGAVTAVVLTSLYSPIGSLHLGSALTETYDLTVGALVGAFLNGLGGARLLTQEVDRRYDQMARSSLARSMDAIVRIPPEADR